LAAIDTIDLQPIEKKKAIVLHNLYFASFQTTILPESEAALQQLYEMLSENPDLRIRIIGHTDDVGSDRDNQILSEGRATSVRQAMIDRGIDGARIETEGKGEKEPVVPNTSDENRAKNRRVEFMIL
jgi:outer membrane protein OmpA-like peptidoglycan-associated protein